MARKHIREYTREHENMQLHLQKVVVMFDIYLVAVFAKYLFLPTPTSRLIEHAAMYLPNTTSLNHRHFIIYRPRVGSVEQGFVVFLGLLHRLILKLSK